MPKTSKGSSGNQKSGFFSKLKNAFSSDNSKDIKLSRSREEDTNNSLGVNLGMRATRTRSRRSLFGSSRESREIEAERELEERKSKCLAIQAAKRDPPAVQRLLVDCEFCNPPPEFGIIRDITTPEFTSENTLDSLRELEIMKDNGVDLQDERTWNVGLDEWIRQREHWLAPDKYQQKPHFLEPELTSSRYYVVYDKLIYQTRPLKHPLNLADAIKIVKSGWVAEGSWPTEGVWTSSEEDLSNNALNSPKLSRGSSYHSAHRQSEHSTNPHSNSQSDNVSGRRRSGSDSNSQANEAEHDSSQGGRPPIPSLRRFSPSPSKDLPNNTSNSRVQFSDRPHPRDLTPVVSNGLPELTRLQSSMSIQQDRSSQLSMISLTDEE